MSKPLAFFAVVILLFPHLEANSSESVPVAPTALGQESRPSASPWDLIGQLAGGEWTAEGQWADGRSFYSRNVYEWGVGRNCIKVKSYAKPAAAEVLLFEAFWHWNAGDEKAEMVTVAAFGGVYKGEIMPSVHNPAEFAIEMHTITDGETKSLRQTFSVSGDSYDWSSYEIIDDHPVLLVKTTFKKTGEVDSLIP